MATLILIRHAHPRVDPDKPSQEWDLSDEGRTGAQRLAVGLSDSGIRHIFTSTEPKAIQTAEIVADHLGMTALPRGGLQEHDRRGVGFLEPIVFDQAIRDLFAKPSERVFGGESGQEVVDRFSAAIGHIERELRDEGLTYACVTHGTAMSLYTSHLAGRDGHALWRGLEIPATIRIDREDRSVVDIVSAY